MCYPCSHCGACKVKLPKGKCPLCGAELPEGGVCPGCGMRMPAPPGRASSGKPVQDASGDATAAPEGGRF